MDSSKKGVLINASWGAWYPKGSDRLLRSMIYHGWDYDVKVWKDDPIDDFFDPKYPYRIKGAAFKEALRLGYTHILWMDCSLWVIDNPNRLMREIDEKGGLFIKSGYNLAQTSSDYDLEWAGIDRNQAEQIPEIWSCVFGVNIMTEQGKKFAEVFMDGYESGVFDSPRTHSGMSYDSRFLHARQDQTAASFAYHKAGFDIIQEPGNLISYYDAGKDTLILMRGM